MEKRRKLSESTLAVLSPLPSYSSFAQERAGKRLRQSRFSLASPVKRQKKTESTNFAATCLPSEILGAVDAIRRVGAAADTLFFPSVPVELRAEAALRAAVAFPLRELKLLPQTKPGGKALAWATFFNEADCVSSLCSLREKMPSLKPRLHKPKSGPMAADPRFPSNCAAPSYSEVFQTRADKVLADGGLADTLMLRGLPLDVSEDEVREMMRDLQGATPPLRTRTCEGSSGKVRNFWITFASRQAAGRAFVALMGQQMSFRCGKTMRIVPVVHNDSKDAESKKRRLREQAMGVHETADRKDSSTPALEPVPMAVRRLESISVSLNTGEPSKRLNRLADLLKSQDHTFSFT